MAQSIGLNLLAKLLLEERLSDFHLLKREYFYDAELPIFDKIAEHVKEHGELPTLNFIQRSVEIEEPDSSDAFGVWHTEYIKRATFNKFNEMLPELQRDLGKHRTIQALDRVSQFVEETHSIRTDGQRDLSGIVQIGQEVIAEFARLRDLKGLSGIPSSWPTLDETTHGFQNGDLIIFAARPAVGKSTVVAKLAVAAHDAGYIPLVVSMEMKRVQLGARLLTMKARTNLRLIRASQMTSFAERALHVAAEEMSARPFHFVEGQFRQSVGELVSLVHSLRPNILFVDGAYLLKLPTTHARMPLWEKIGEIAQVLKNIAITCNIPVVCTFQINREGGKKDKSGQDMGVEHLQLSDAIGQLASLIVGIFADEGSDDTDSTRQRRMKILKGREGEAGQWHIRWDFSSMCFDEVRDHIPQPQEEAEREYDHEDVLA